MRIVRLSFFVLASVLVSSAVAGQMTPAGAFKRLPTYDYDQPRAPLAFLELHVAKASGDAKTKQAVASRLGAILADGKTTLAAKRFICKQLLLVGDDSHVPTLVKMLNNPKTVDMARRTLEGIPGEASLQALRDALGRLKGLALVGVVNSLGVRRDAASARALAQHVTGQDATLAAAALEALGKIASTDAWSTLMQANASGALLGRLRDAQLMCAQRMDPKPAAALYRKILDSKPPLRWRMGAVVGLVKVDPRAAVPLILDADDSQLRAQGYQIMATTNVNDTAITDILTAKLPELPPADKVLLIDVLAQRGDRAAGPAVTGLASAKDETVRLAAIRALGTLGGAKTIDLLAGLAAASQGSIQAAARESLHRVPGKQVDARIVALVPQGKPPLRAELVRAIGARGITSAGPLLLKAATDPDPGVRAAAFGALALVGDAPSYAPLIELLVAASSSGDARAAERALVAVGNRLPDVDGRVDPVLTALTAAPPKPKATLLRVLGGYGGAKALAAVRGLLTAKDADVQTAAVRALGNWPDGAAAPDLLKLASEAANPAHRVLALRGYLRLASLAASPAERLKRLERVRPIATTTDAKRMLLGTLGGVADAGALHVAMGFVGDAEVHGEAAMAALTISRALLAIDRVAVREPMQKLAAAAKDKAIAKQAEAIYAESLKRPATRGANPALLRVNPARSAALKKALAAKAPKGYRLACYIDCGPDALDGAKGGPTLKLVDGSPYGWGGGPATADQVRYITIFFTGSQVAFDATGLNPRKTYQLGFSWWDYDHDDRTQSVWATAGKPPRAVKLVDRTKLPSGLRGQAPQEKTVAIPRTATVHGSARITFRLEGGTNCVVSEVWLWESDADSTAKLPPPPPPRKKGGTPVVVLTGIEYPGHPWRQTAPALADLLLKDPRLDVEILEDATLAHVAKLRSYKVCVLNYMNWQKPDPPAAALESFRQYVAEGGGLVLVHFACGAFQKWPEFVKIAGRVWNPKMRGHDPHGTFRVAMTDVKHPITEGMKPFETLDELYTCLDGKTPISVLATATSKVDKKVYPMVFVLTYGKGRVFHCVLGHDLRAFQAVGVRELFRRGTAWAAGLPPVLAPK